MRRKEKIKPINLGKINKALDKDNNLRALCSFTTTFKNKRELCVFLQKQGLISTREMDCDLLLYSYEDDKIFNAVAYRADAKYLDFRQLEEIIKLDEYKRLPKETKNKLITNKESNIIDFVKNPIIIRNHSNYEFISEKVLQKLILEDMESFMKELGNSFSFIGSEYKIRVGNSFNYIDLLLFNIEYNCYVVVELKVTELKKEHIGQIQVYMNYIDKNLKKIKR